MASAAFPPVAAHATSEYAPFSGSDYTHVLSCGSLLLSLDPHALFLVLEFLDAPSIARLSRAAVLPSPRRSIRAARATFVVRGRSRVGTCRRPWSRVLEILALAPLSLI